MNRLDLIVALSELRGFANGSPVTMGGKHVVTLEVDWLLKLLNDTITELRKEPNDPDRMDEAQPATPSAADK